MRICIYGAGAVGGYLAGFLARGGATVSVVARGAHLAAIQADGLRVETPDESLLARVKASDDPQELGIQDLVIVSVKAPSQTEVARRIAPLLGPDTPVVFIANGIPWWYFHAHGGVLEGQRLPRLDPEGALWRMIGPERVIGGVFWPACSVPAPGLIRLSTGADSGTIFGELNGKITSRLGRLAEAFRAAALPVGLSDAIRTLIWRKLAFNLSAGPLCVLAETTVMGTQTEAALIACSRRLVTEAVAVARALDIKLDLDLVQIVAGNMKMAHRPSILQDLEAGRQMEVDALYMVPLELARMAGASMPTLELLAALIAVKARAKHLYAA